MTAEPAAKRRGDLTKHLSRPTLSGRPMEEPNETAHAKAGSVIGTLTIPGSAEQVSRVRDFVGTTLGPRPSRDCVVLLASEIVTNSILHSASGDGGEVNIVIIDLGASVRIEVADEGSDCLPTVHRSDTGLSDGGRGLQIVAALAASWGHARDNGRLLTWFEAFDI